MGEPMNESMTEKHQKKPSKTRFFLLAGILLLIGFGYGTYSIYSFVTMEHAKATVLSVKTIHSRNTGSGSSTTTTYEPILSFMDNKGNSRTLSTGYSSSQFNFERGEIIPIIYDINNPSRFRITTFSSFWIWPIIAISFGLFVVFMGYWTREKKGQGEDRR